MDAPMPMLGTAVIMSGLGLQRQWIAVNSARALLFFKIKTGYTALRLTVVECDEDDSAINLPLY